LLLFKAEQAVFQFYFKKTPLHQQHFLIISFFYFALVAEKFEKMSKMKLLSSFQLATLLADVSIKTVQATAHRIFLYMLRDDMN